ncbi:MAG TPA: response regulator [Tepidisphaeraceae bacterium]|nr:response regulator [Tepidisphaeraceae bacterium]
MVEDNPADVRLTLEAFRECKVQNTLHVAKDGVEAMAFLRREDKYASVARPNLIFLDLNLPRKNGREVLVEIKSDPNLRRIPVVILTTSRSDTDITKCYDLHANCYVVKPVDLDEFIQIIHHIENFWLNSVAYAST